LVWAVAQEIGWIVAVAVIALRLLDIHVYCIKMGGIISSHESLLCLGIRRGFFEGFAWPVSIS
jgi:hypothetical protein